MARQPATSGAGPPTPPEPHDTGGARGADARWALVLQVLGAGAGIGAWIAVVGGARLWARLDALHVPAAQTVSVMPRELLIAEGFRTLLVPLLLGAAIAVLAYLSRRDSETEKPAPAETHDRSGEAVGAGVEAVDAAKALVRELKAVCRAADRVSDAGAAEDVKVQVQALDEVTRRAYERLAESVSALRDAEAATDTARQDSPPGARQDGFLAAGRRFAGERERHEQAYARLATLRGALLAGTPDSAERIAAARESREPIRELAMSVLDAGDATAQALHELREAGRPSPGEGVAQLWLALTQLAPTAYLQRWLGSLERRFGRGVAVAMIIVLVGGFAAIALALVSAVTFHTGIPVGVTAVLLGVVVLVRRRWAGAVALLALPVLVLVAFVAALGPKYFGYLLLATFLTAWLTMGAMDRWPHAGAVAWTLFIAIAFWSGALAFIAERAATTTELETVVVRQRSPAPAVLGLYLGRTSKQVYLASTGDCDAGDCRKVLSIPDKQVTCLVFGPAEKVSDVPSTEPVEFLEHGTTKDPCAGATPTPTPAKTKTKTKTKTDRGSASGPIRLFSPLQITLGMAAPPGARDAGPRVVLDSDVWFRFGSDELAAGARARLRDVAAVIRGTRAAQVFIAGHTDSRGSRRDNLDLSRRRAAAVEAGLRRWVGRDAPAMTPKGFGETAPVACNTRPDGSDDWTARAYNRRVEIWVGHTPTYPNLDCTR
jgi:outer membrane protein OmpA-like peptidoglycan-associated protein